MNKLKRRSDMLSKRNVIIPLIALASLMCCFQLARDLVDVEKNLDYCVTQAGKTLAQINRDSVFPRDIEKDGKRWNFVRKEEWTSGFWPGILWYLYEYTGDAKWKIQADRFTGYLNPLTRRPAVDHDLGFQVFCSFGNGYRLSHDPGYKKAILRSADTLATLFNPKVGTILSWPFMIKKEKWPHNTIADNMMNLELLFWASKNGGSKSLYDIAVKHAETTMKNHFRADYSAYHVVLYDAASGKKIRGITYQGYSDESMWARGQAWTIYGYTVTYRETRDSRFLDFAQKLADVYIKRLPADLIPFWDFDDPEHGLKDASAAAITASALIELSTFVPDRTKAAQYFKLAGQMISELSSRHYQSRDSNSAFLLHTTGNKPANSGLDCSITYADYYYLESLIRLKRLAVNQTIYDYLR
ncbi:unsaturated chondroitin disaccharide hydrolase [Pedobacter africanus]|uniref:Unsaturated chondroitin disaccharide hydrolase n=1 Tax=Pedobacter africanus TaxID=151894 RepID=A0ACC6L229_9SPHI|nr:glycoside hydrolase family 88 protein [Pedobacter africanus]MDR6785546.1 unsaturated chondroitin disaccharide hydrolase [Pedobacter africanus]